MRVLIQDAENIVVKVIRDKKWNGRQLTINIRDETAKAWFVNDFPTRIGLAASAAKERSLGGSFDLQSQFRYQL